jgi:DNA-binding NarL/FixJ family response regulator
VDEVRILIADDHEVVRRGLVLVLNLEPGIRVVGEAHDGAEAIAKAKHLQPDVIILDMKMPVINGRETARQIKQSLPNSKVIILSGAGIDDDVIGTLNDRSIEGYLLKDASPAELSRAIWLVVGGESYIDPVLAQTVAERQSHHAGGRSPIHLTEREREILNLLATSATYEEIGAKLFISEETVRSHAKNILAKLGQHNRAMAVIEAVRLGLITLK